MAKKKVRPFRAVKAVKSAAREAVGQPPPAQVLPDKKKSRQSKPKHKTTLVRLLEENH
jgi:hypothetical protein